MPITINTNISAMTAQRNLGISSNRSASSLSKLSSGSRVPAAKDDAAALAVGTGLRADIAAYRQAQLNAQQGAAMLQVADGGFSQITDILVRMKSLASQAQSGQISDSERDFLDVEYQQLLGEIDRIAATTEFNGVDLLGESSTIELNANGTDLEAADGFSGFQFDSGIVANADQFHVFYDDSEGTFTLFNDTQSTAQTIELTANYTVGSGDNVTLDFSQLGVTITLNDQFGGGDVGTVVTGANFQFTAQTAAAAVTSATVTIQVGIGTTANDSVSISINGGDAATLASGLESSDLQDATNAGTASGLIDTALAAVNTARAEIGAGISQLEFAGNNVAVAVENLSAAKSVLMDVDVSAEITEFSSQQVLIQAGVSMLAQANQQPSLLLRLLQ